MQKLKKLADTNQPFYGDVLARSLLRIGVPKYEAYQIAHKIWQQISHKKKDLEQIVKLVKGVLHKKYPRLVKHYDTWREIMEKDVPLIILIGGGTGIGTSTLAMRLAWLLEMDTVVSTDSVREVIRQFLDDKVLPILHVSSYETGKLIKEVKSPRDSLIYGFLSQSKEVLNGVEAIIKRAIKEKSSLVIEGVHIIPGEMAFLKKYENDAFIIQIMLDVDQKEKHKLHFFSRHLQSIRRDKAHYLKYFKEIRLIRDYLIDQAKKHKALIIQNYDLRKAEKEVLDKIYSSFTHKKK
jgi:2-phosphoglycerate kinase